MQITPAQCKAARALIGWSQDDLAERSGVARTTIRNFETGGRIPYPANMAAIIGALEQAGVEFIEGNGGGPGVRLRMA